MKLFLSILFLIFSAISGIAGPPEPPEAPEPPSVNIPDITIPKIDTQKLNEMTRGLGNLNSKLAGLDKMLQHLSDSITIKDLSIAGDSIVIILSNDSVLTLQSGSDTVSVPRKDNSFVNVGSKYTVDEGKVINGNIVNVGADVIVRGLVNGSVWTIGGDIYVTSTGYVRDGAIAVSGKLKVEPGGRVTNLKVALNESRHNIDESDSNAFRIMAAIFLGIFLIWMVLAATFTSLLKTNVVRVANLIHQRPWKSFFVGYLAYLLALAAIIVLTISILGIPLALVGMPVAIFASMVLAVTAVSQLIGQRLTGSSEINFRTFLYGTLLLAGLPCLFFIIQFLTGSLVFMIFSWLMIALLIFVIVPFGLGAVLSTRFGTRDFPPAPIAPSSPPQPQVVPQTPTA